MKRVIIKSYDLANCRVTAQYFRVFGDSVNLNKTYESPSFVFFNSTPSAKGNMTMVGRHVAADISQSRWFGFGLIELLQFLKRCKSGVYGEMRSNDGKIVYHRLKNLESYKDWEVARRQGLRGAIR